MSDQLTENNPLRVRDREPRQGARFSEPKIGGLYPLAGIFLGGVAVGVTAAFVAMT